MGRRAAVRKSPIPDSAKYEKPRCNATADRAIAGPRRRGLFLAFGLQIDEGRRRPGDASHRNDGMTALGASSPFPRVPAKVP
jgi:hypothetical protein